MIRERLIPLAWLFLACILIGGSWGLSSAKADPSYSPAEICARLDDFPTFTAIRTAEANIIADTGWSAAQAEAIVSDSIYEVCPQHIGLFEWYLGTGVTLA